MSEQLKIKLTDDEKRAMCNVISSAIDANNEIFSQLSTTNGWPITFWDNIASKMEEEFEAINCKPFIVRRGCWEFSILYIRGHILLFMREKRFTEIQKLFNKNSENTHYLPNLATILNADIPVNQQNLFCLNKRIEKAKEVTEKVLKEIYAANEKIERLCVVLFEADKGSLYSIRLVLVNGALEVCDQINLNEYIERTQSVVADSVTEYPEMAPVDPTKSLRFTSKAESKKASKERQFKKENTQKGLKSIK